MEEEQAYCGVRFPVKKGLLQAVLTGDHFPPEETAFAHALLSADEKEAMQDGCSPMFLVPDQIIREAWNGSKFGGSGAALKLSKCRAGRGRKPCGERECKECEKARDEFFNHLCLNNVELKGELADKIKKAVFSVLGGTVVPKPFGENMDEEEFLHLTNEMRNDGEEP